MALTTVRSDTTPPTHALTFTTFAAQRVLHDGNGTSCPSSIFHLPCSLFVNADDADVLAFKDVLGVTNTITFTGPFVGHLYVAAASLETTTTCDSVTVFWNPEP
jgi:hypothetical protein